MINQILNDIVKQLTIALIKEISNEESLQIHLLIDTGHIKYLGQKTSDSQMNLAINNAECIDLKTSKEFLSFAKMINDKKKNFKIPYEAILSIYIPESNFILEKEKTLLYTVYNLKKNLMKTKDILETSVKEAKIVNISQYIDKS